MTSEPWGMGAARIAGAIAERRLTAREVVESHLTRIEKVNAAVNAITVLLAHEALRVADEADRRLAAGEAIGPLHGVPFTIKENIDVAGSPTPWGVVALEHAAPGVDAPHIGRLRAAGAIPLARTNLAELALRWHTASGLRGATVNPWDASKTPGGSSGGDAVALATGMTPLGVGNDLGGSLRVPSHCCGTAALRPSFGRVAQANALDVFRDPILTLQVFNAQGPMARSVEDLRLAFGAMAGTDVRDPWSVPVAALPPLPRPVRVAAVTSAVLPGIDGTVDAGIRRAAEALCEAGYVVEEVAPPRLEEAADTWATCLVAEVAAVADAIGPIASEEARQCLDLLFQIRRPADRAGLVSAYMTRHAIAREWAEFAAERPLVLAPVMTHPPFDVGWDLAGPSAVEELAHRMRTVVPVNLLGLPAVALPVGVEGGLPQGVQVIGSRFRDEACLDAARAIEERLGTITPIDPRV